MNTPKYRRPLDPAVALWADGLDLEAREFFEERAAVREFDGLQSRAVAEANAKIETEHFLAGRHRGVETSQSIQKNQK